MLKSRSIIAIAILSAVALFGVVPTSIACTTSIVSGKLFVMTPDYGGSGDRYIFAREEVKPIVALASLGNTFVIKPVAFENLTSIVVDMGENDLKPIATGVITAHKTAYMHDQSQWIASWMPDTSKSEVLPSRDIVLTADMTSSDNKANRLPAFGFS